MHSTLHKIKHQKKTSPRTSQIPVPTLSPRLFVLNEEVVPNSAILVPPLILPNDAQPPDPCTATNTLPYPPIATKLKENAEIQIAAKKSELSVSKFPPVSVTLIKANNTGTVAIKFQSIKKNFFKTFNTFSFA